MAKWGGRASVLSRVNPDIPKHWAGIFLDQLKALHSELYPRRWGEQVAEVKEPEYPTLYVLGYKNQSFLFDDCICEGEQALKEVILETMQDGDEPDTLQVYRLEPVTLHIEGRFAYDPSTQLDITIEHDC